MLGKFYCEMIFVEAVAKKIDAPKMSFPKAFWSDDFFVFLPWLQPMSFHNEVLQTLRTFVDVYH